MERIPEPELMDEAEQARAYAEADFSGPHDMFVQLFREAFPDTAPAGAVLDLGCGPADVTRRFASAFGLGPSSGRQRPDLNRFCEPGYWTFSFWAQGTQGEGPGAGVPSTRTSILSPTSTRVSA